MAYASQELKAARTPEVKSILKQYGLKGSLSIQHHSILKLTITAGSIDFFESANRMNAAYAARRGETPRTVADNLQVNQYYIGDHFDGVAAVVLSKLVLALKGNDYYDRTDLQADIFDCSHYIAIELGKWNKPYQLIK